MFASFNVDNYTLRELLGNGKTYTVPPFQRDYSWEQEQWEDLWLDVLDIVQAPKPEHHYMAYVLLKKNGNDNNNFSIIDGQQILTTISIMILCILRYIEKNAQTHHENYEHDFERSKIIRSTYIGALDAVTLLTQSKLNLNKNNNFYYQKYLVPLRPLPTRGHKASELLLRSASEWFDKKIDAYIKTKKILSHDTSKELSLLVEKMADNLFFTVITVTDELNAYTVFETLNARGVKLSASDLFKNYLFSLIYNADETDNTEMNELSERWTQLSVRLENNNFTEFLRCYWIGHYKSVRQLSLFKEIQKTMNTQEKAYQLLKDLEECVETYINLANPNSGIFTGDTKKYAMILKDFNVKQFYCLVLASTRILSETELTKLLKIFVVISFRYNVIASLPPYELEAYYQKIALDITNGNIKNLNDIIHALRDIYVSDDKFETDFTQASFPKTYFIAFKKTTDYTFLKSLNKLSFKYIK